MKIVKKPQGPRPTQKCPHCQKTVALNMLQRWHLNNCKHRKKEPTMNTQTNTHHKDARLSKEKPEINIDRAFLKYYTIQNKKLNLIGYICKRCGGNIGNTEEKASDHVLKCRSRNKYND